MRLSLGFNLRWVQAQTGSGSALSLRSRVIRTESEAGVKVQSMIGLGPQSVTRIKAQSVTILRAQT